MQTSRRERPPETLSWSIMIDPNMELVSTVVLATIERITADENDTGAWAELQSAFTVTKCDDEELELAIEVQELDELKRLVEEWHSAKRHYPACDRDVLKRAMKAFRKSLKVTRLAAESSLSGGPLSGGSDFTVVGIMPPPRYPKEVWNELARQKRLVTDGKGTFELPPGG